MYIVYNLCHIIQKFISLECWPVWPGGSTAGILWSRSRTLWPMVLLWPHMRTLSSPRQSICSTMQVISCIFRGFIITWILHQIFMFSNKKKLVLDKLLSPHSTLFSHPLNWSINKFLVSKLNWQFFPCHKIHEF